MNKLFRPVIYISIFLSVNLNANPLQTLENLNAYEKSNAIIDIECEEEFKAQAAIIEKTWAAGNQKEAIELLKNSFILDDANLGIQWKKPVKTNLRWGNDAAVSGRDSVSVVCLDVDNNTGNLFSVLKYHISTHNYWCLNMSSDTGKSWSEIYNWGDLTGDIDGAVLKGYFYVAYSTTTTGDGRMDKKV